MKPEEQFSDEFLNAFLDGELAPEERTQLYNRLGDNEPLDRKLCELRKVRDLVQFAYATPPAEPREPAPRGRRHLFVAAAAMVIGLAGAIGIWRPVHTTGVADLLAQAPQQEPVKVLLHLNSGSMDRMREVLDEAEELLGHYAAIGQKARIEIITNGSGLNLLRSDTTPFAGRIRKLYREHNNLVFVACQNTIDRAKREEKFSPPLVPEAVVIDSAVAQIMRRQHQGWAYIQV